MKVLIQGAGPAGLVLAIALQRAGHEVQVVDRATPDRRDGFAVGLHASGWRAMERLDLIPALKARQMPLAEARYLRSDLRPHIAYDYRRIGAAMGGRIMAIMRDDLQDVLIAAAEGISLRWQTSVVDLAQDASGINVKLGDGSQSRHDLVVGADGYRSGLRRLVFADLPDPVRPLGYRVVSWKFRPASPLAASVIGLADIDRQATLYALPDGGAATLFCWREADMTRLGAEDRRAAVLAQFDGWPDPVAGAIAAADWDQVFLDSVAQIEMPFWSRGRVVLLGDAAWNLAFLSGQGTTLATAGAMLLADALQNRDPVAAIEAWEARLRPMVTRLQAGSRRIGGQYVPVSRTGMWLQSLLAPILFSRPLLPMLVRRMAGPEIPTTISAT
ncbi:FAD-dependent monooxygenase [Paenirhodobacter sp.]|uniref:FAD-dependent monooxygenase n=1 Tax=Paenirhodobacter sp. TaxID=1965326 RepID=UPI003B3D2B26